MADFLKYKDKPLVGNGKEIYYGDMSDKYVIKFIVNSSKKVGDIELPEKVTVQLIKSDIQLDAKDAVKKETTKDNFFDALDVGFVWLERALKG